MRIFIDRQEGFTLVEIMIIVGIVALLATVAIPQMLRSRVNANEVAAVGNIRALYHACSAYYNVVRPHGYPDSLTDLTTPTSNPPFISSGLANAATVTTAIQGYYYVYTPAQDNEAFTIIAWPSRFGRTGTRNFFVDEIGLLTYTGNQGEVPVANSTPVK